MTINITPGDPLSLEDVVNEFGGDDPDAMDEYYRNAGLVTDNNTGVPTSGEMEMSVFYGTQLIHTKFITVNTSQLVMSTLFSETEWTSTAPKQVVINAGVSVYSTNPGVVACRTGTTVNAQPMGGTLELIVNGFIYGAGGAAGASQVGGSSLQAEVLLNVTNNSNIWSGGGGGGIGGEGADVYYYADTVSYQYNRIAWLDTNNTLWEWNNAPSEGIGVNYAFSAPTLIFGGDSGNQERTSWVNGDYLYERGTFKMQYQVFNVWHFVYSVRRRFNWVIVGGTGGDGGQGQGYNQSATAGSAGTTPLNARSGGTGGSGASWGATGGTGASGQAYDPTFNTLVSSQTSGATGGLAGFYIIGNANVTWNVIGSRLGRVS